MKKSLIILFSVICVQLYSQNTPLKCRDDGFYKDTVSCIDYGFYLEEKGMELSSSRTINGEEYFPDTTNNNQFRIGSTNNIFLGSYNSIMNHSDYCFIGDGLSNIHIESCYNVTILKDSKAKKNVELTIKNFKNKIVVVSENSYKVINL